MEELKYPIYKFSLHWNQDDYKNNCTFQSRMYKTKPTFDELMKDLNNWWTDLLNHVDGWYESKLALKDKHPELLDLHVEFYEEATWCLKWFSHITFNHFENQQETFRSFNKFVQEKLPLHMNQDYPNDYLKSHPELKTYCLMGAEDSWRWKLCTCDECKREGITAILH
jgi:hypothetical protein